MMKVLYAEDERQLSVAVVEILKMEGFDVTPVYDGEEALEALDKDYFDAVVLDIMMPKKDGIEVLEAMRKNGNHTCVLMLTAKATLDDRIAGLSTGADDYLSKPFAMKELFCVQDEKAELLGFYVGTSIARPFGRGALCPIRRFR